MPFERVPEKPEFHLPVPSRLKRMLRKHFEAQRELALYNLEAYLNGPAGIGEHGNLGEEVIKNFKVLTEAEGCLETLSDYSTPEEEKLTEDPECPECGGIEPCG